MFKDFLILTLIVLIIALVVGLLKLRRDQYADMFRNQLIRDDIGSILDGALDYTTGIRLVNEKYHLGLKRSRKFAADIRAHRREL